MVELPLDLLLIRSIATTATSLLEIAKEECSDNMKMNCAKESSPICLIKSVQRTVFLEQTLFSWIKVKWPLSRVLFIQCLMLWAVGVWGQRIKKITTNDGLSQGFVSGIAQGQSGFIWAASLNGLNRFDGESFKTYKYNSDDSLSLSSDIVNRLVKDSNGYLWLLNNDNLQVYDAVRDGFITPEYFKKQPLTTGGSLGFDPLSRLWVFHLDTIFCYPISTSEGKHGLEAVATSLPPYIIPAKYGKILTIFPTIDRIYIGTEDGRVHELLLASGAITTLPLPLTTKVSRISVDPQFGGLWVQCLDKMVYYDGLQVRSFEGVRTTNSVLAVQALSRNGKTYLFSNTEIYVWDNIKLEKLPVQIPEFILSACIDHQGNIWVGTNAQGIRYIELEHYNFPTIQRGFCNMRPVLPAPDGKCWVFSPSKNDVNQGQYLRLLPDGRLGESVSSLLCQYMAVDAHNCFWVAQGSRLARINHPGASPQYINLPPHSSIIRSIYCAKNDLIWLTTNDSELIWYDAKKGTSKLIHLNTPDLFPPGSFKNKDYYSNFWEDEKGRLWLGFSAGVVGIKLDPITGVYEKVVWNGKVKDKPLLKEHGVLSVTGQKGFPDLLWIGTPSGLVRWNMTTQAAVLFGVKDGLPDDYIYSVIDGGGGEIWLGSNKGLIGFRPDTRFSRLLTEDDGLPAAEFNTSCAVSTWDSSVLFLNTVSGIISFKPSDLRSSGQSSSMVLTGMYVNGQSYPVQYGEPEGLTFSHQENSITIEYALLSFSDASVNRYEYKINAENSPWIHIGTKNSLTFPLLSPGRYTVWIKGITSEGQESKPLKITFIIEWPWWKTWWAYGIFAILILFLIWVVMKIRMRFQRLQYEYALKAQEITHREVSERQRMRLLENITHEIRTPLTVILGQVEQMKTGLPQGYEADLNLLERGVNDLNHLSHQVLQLSKNKGEARLPKMEAGNLSLLVRQIADYFQYLATLKSIDFQLDIEEPSIWMLLDEVAIKGIISNLLSNAIKFTAVQGRVYLGLYRTQEKVRIVVRDTGVGMSPEVQSKIFERFYQSEDAQEYAGTGIGLSYVDDLVKSLDGKIWVESEVGKGSMFSVELPLEAVEPETEADWAAPTAEYGGSKAWANTTDDTETTESALILVVEDNPVVAAYVIRGLATEYEVIAASDGISGQKLALERMPDLIITDLMLPGVDGWEFCAQIKNNVLTNHIPVVMVTALIEETDRIKGLKTGADAYIAKPFLQEELMLVVKNLLTLKQRIAQQASASSAPQNAPASFGQQDSAFITQAILSQVAPEHILFLQKVMGVIEAHFSEKEFTLNELEKAMGLSRTQLYRKMVAITGKSAGFYLRRRRLEEGMHLLQKRADMNITEISYACGFNDPNYFSTAFSAEFGHPPSFFQS